MATNATVQPIKTDKVEIQAASIPSAFAELEADLGLLTKAQLLDMAADLGIEGVKSTMRKGELIEQIEAAKGMRQ